MNERELKSGLRQLSHEGWFVAEVTDDFLQVLVGQPGDPPSDEVKDRCLSKLRARVQNAMNQQAEQSGDSRRGLSFEPGQGAPRHRRNRKSSPGKGKT